MASSSSFLVSALLIATSLSSLMLAAGAQQDNTSATAAQPCFPAIFPMGDSLFDKGNDLILHPLARGFLFNETYMSRPRDYASQGRLLIDYIAQAFGLVSPSPYMQSVTPNYRNGVNLATFGATATGVPFGVLYTLDIQLYWLRRFLDNVEALSNSTSTGSSLTEGLPTIENFQKGLYVIAVGGNDYTAFAKNYNQSMPSVRTNVTDVVSKINSTITALMGGGARNFLVVNVPPIGCSTQSREAYANALGNANGDISTRLDEHNCLRPLNDVIDLHNTQLRDLLQALRNKHQDGLFVYVDYNGVIRSMLSSRFTSILAGRCLCDTCAGCYNNVHITSEAANRLTTLQFLNGDFVEPRGVFSQCLVDLRLN